MQRFTDMDDQITQREKDIIQIAKSIQELAEIFNDLNMLVIDQVRTDSKSHRVVCFTDLTIGDDFGQN